MSALRKLNLFVAAVGAGRLTEIQVEAETLRDAIRIAEKKSGATVSCGQSQDVVNR